MDRFMHSKIEEETIYEIYRACRLCGAGAGYKMPIIQNVVNLDDVPLAQKIRECVQIEVHQDDKMPPLICELCVDKVNDFYEFSEMCKQTNRRTRLRLGLPPQMLSRGTPNAGDCILGITEPVYVAEDSNEPIIKNKQTKQRNKSKKGLGDDKFKPSENRRNSQARRPSPEDSRRSTRGSVSSPTNILTLRNKTNKDTKTVDQLKKKVVEPLKSILKKERTFKSKRGSDRDTPEGPVKRVKIDVTVSKSATCKSPRPRPRARSPEPGFVCQVCGRRFNSKMSLTNHMRIHPDEKNSKTKNNSSSVRTRVSRDNTERPQSKVRSERNLKLKRDKLICGNCGKRCSTWLNLRRHESSCSRKKKVSIDPELLSQVRPVQVRVSRCDPLLRNNYTCNVSNIHEIYGLDMKCIYPYIPKDIKKELETGRDGMVRIEDGIKEEFNDPEYTHWDSDGTDTSDIESSSKKKTPSLSTLCLKVIFSTRYLGRVRKRRKVKIEPTQDATDENIYVFDGIEKFDDVHDLERINDCSFDQLLDKQALNDAEGDDNNKDVSTKEMDDKDTDENALNEHTDKQTNIKDSVVDKEYINKEKGTIDDNLGNIENVSNLDVLKENTVQENNSVIHVEETTRTTEIYEKTNENERIIENTEGNDATIDTDKCTDFLSSNSETNKNKNNKEEEFDNLLNTDVNGLDENTEVAGLPNDEETEECQETEIDTVKEEFTQNTVSIEENSNNSDTEIEENSKNSSFKEEMNLLKEEKSSDFLTNTEEYNRNGELITENYLLGAEVVKDSELSGDGTEYKSPESDEKSNNSNKDIDHFNSTKSTDTFERTESKVTNENEKVEINKDLNETTSNINETEGNDGSFDEDKELINNDLSTNINEADDIMKAVLNKVKEDRKKLEDITDYTNERNRQSYKLDDGMELEDQRLMDEIDEQIGEELISKQIDLEEFSEEF